MGVFIAGFSSIFTGINFIATIHKLRAPGMGWFDMPLFCWGMYATALIQVLATPVLAITLLLMTIERTFRIGIFDASLGGDPVLFQHFFWFYSHPAVYIMIVPGMAIISEIIPSFQPQDDVWLPHGRVLEHRHRAHRISGLGPSHVRQRVIPDCRRGLFVPHLPVAIPSGIKIWNWLATMYHGLNQPGDADAVRDLVPAAVRHRRLDRRVPGTLSIDVHLTDTYFVVAHFHYVMMGGTVIAFLGGLHYWWPKMTGRMYNERLGQIAAVIVFIGFNATFFPQFIMGGQGCRGATTTTSNSSSRCTRFRLWVPGSLPRAFPDSWISARLTPQAVRCSRQPLGRKDSGVDDTIAAHHARTS